MNKLRIALITANYHHVQDGVSLTLNRLVRYLLDEGHEVLVFAPHVEDPPMEHAGEIFPNRAVFRIPGREEYLFPYAFPEECRQKLRSYNPDIVHIATPDFSGCQALLETLRMNKPVVTSYHTHFISYFDYYKIGRFKYWGWMYQRWFYRNCIHTYVPTQSVIDDLRQNGQQNDLRIWARGIDLERFGPHRRSLEWRRRHVFSDDDKVVTMVSRLVQEKEMDTLIAVYRKLHSSGQPVKTLIVGEGPERNNMETALPDTVFTGHLEGTELATAYASSDIFIFPSYTETFGNVTLEAQASGVPPVVADAQGNRSLVDDGVNGFLVKPRDIDGFAGRILQLASDESLRSKLSGNAIKTASEYSWPAILSGLVTNYYEAIQTHQERNTIST